MCKGTTPVKVYLFDWGDTLMVDFPNQKGKMCDWNYVEAVEGAQQALSTIAQHSHVYIATSADDSSELDIKRAFQRVELDKYISGYFCKVNLGIAKGSAEFYLEIVKRIGLKPNQVVMVGDTVNKDIQPAIQAGLSAIWFNPLRADSELSQNVEQITSLTDLIQ
ncbi:HAD family hydrolase [Vibrio sp. ZSDE26]|uniref:HAD family hydrolase n=1 Tax=Vibrio amylolyticus TaxID=2847292 RepID=A0A9X1XHM4_9VIBR|nr:HAD family hydrolase [Vibrio amylolyticus]MCK6262951.1 HAD family hydrolase [Vibrio amylolyticus]